MKSNLGMVESKQGALSASGSLKASAVLLSWLVEFAWFFCGISAFESAEVHSLAQVFINIHIPIDDSGHAGLKPQNWIEERKRLWSNVLRRKTVKRVKN